MQKKNLLPVLESEVSWWSQLPAADPLVPLLFVNNPSLSGKYQATTDFFQEPNQGLHALKANAPPKTPQSINEIYF